MTILSHVLIILFGILALAFQMVPYLLAVEIYSEQFRPLLASHCCNILGKVG